MPKAKTGKSWIKQWFNAKITVKRGVVRRKKADIEKYASLDLVKREAKIRNWHVVEVGDQWVVICNPGNVRIIL